MGFFLAGNLESGGIQNNSTIVETHRVRLETSRGHLVHPHPCSTQCHLRTDHSELKEKGNNLKQKEGGK